MRGTRRRYSTRGARARDATSDLRNSAPGAFESGQMHVGTFEANTSVPISKYMRATAKTTKQTIRQVRQWRGNWRY